MGINILLATRNRKEAFKEAMKSLALQVNAKDMDLIFMDGNEDDSYIRETLDELGQPFAGFKIFDDSDLPQEKLRWPSIYNFLAQNTFGDCTSLTYWSDDVILSDNRMFMRAENLLHSHKSFNNAGAVAFPFINEHAPNRLMIQPIAGCPDQTQPLINYGLISSDVFHELGGIDENYRFYHADCDISHRIVLDGWNILMYPYLNSYVYHTRKEKVWCNPLRKGDEIDFDYYKKKFGITNG